MKTTLTSLLLVVLFLLAPRASHAQFAFGMKEFVAADNAYGKVSIPAAAWAAVVKASNQGISDKDACLLPTAAGTLQGWQADYDGDGKEEMWVLYSNGPDPACNLCAVLSPAEGGTFTLHDLLVLRPGSALMRPIVTLESGVQMYVQNTYALPDGTTETKGSILSLRQSAIVILISWTQKSFVVDGKKITEVVTAGWTDTNFDNRKELLLGIAKHDGPAPSQKNMLERYVLTLDYLPSHMRYGIYDSTGWDKVQQAEKLAAAGQRMLGRATVRDEGIVKIREALTYDPFMTKARVRLGTFFLNDGKYSDAEKTFLIARDLDPGYAQTHKMLGDTYLRLNDLQKALASYQKYLELAPKESKDRKKVEHNVKQITIPKARIKY